MFESMSIQCEQHQVDMYNPEGLVWKCPECNEEDEYILCKNKCAFQHFDDFDGDFCSKCGDYYCHDCVFYSDFEHGEYIGGYYEGQYLCKTCLQKPEFQFENLTL